MGFPGLALKRVDIVDQALCKLARQVTSSRGLYHVVVAYIPPREGVVVGWVFNALTVVLCWDFNASTVIVDGFCLGF